MELRPEKNGVGLLDLFRGNTKPYQLWDADLWKCPGCGYEIVVGFGADPIAVHYEGDIGKVCQEYRSKSRLIECRES